MTPGRGGGQLIAFARDGKVIVMDRRIYDAFLAKAKE